MGLLNGLFSSAEGRAKNAGMDEQLVAKHWKDYLATIPQKEQIIARLPFAFGEKRQLLQQLIKLLDLELADTASEEKEESEIISDISSLEHDSRIMRVHRLEECLAFASTKYHYFHELLRNLFSALKSERIASEQMLETKDLGKYRKQFELLKQELAVEQAVLAKLNSRESFVKLFSELVLGEQIINVLDKKERRIANAMRKGSPVGGITDKWVVAILDALEERVLECIARDELEQGAGSFFEFVNSDGFVAFAREVLMKVRARNVSEPIFNAFVHSFREKFNYERD